MTGARRFFRLLLYAGKLLISPQDGEERPLHNLMAHVKNLVSAGPGGIHSTKVCTKFKKSYFRIRKSKLNVHWRIMFPLFDGRSSWNNKNLCLDLITTNILVNQ
jgi:hypothetical protein